MTLYVRPAGLVYGPDAGRAFAAGTAGRLGGGPIGFTLVELIRRDGLRELVPFAEATRKGGDAAAAILARITAPRPQQAGLDFSRPQVMGIVNVTPDSFSDGGQHDAAGAGAAHGARLAAEGARILDVGGESTRPGSEGVPEAEELARVLPAVSALAAAGHLVSIDTRKPGVMRAAAGAGARILNDVTALGFAPDSRATAAALGLPVILMHSRGDPKSMQADPRYDDAALDVYDELAAKMAAAEAAGIARERIMIDPGIGFAKTFRHNLEILQQLTLFHGLGVPLVFGASRKAFIGALTGEKTAGRRMPGSLGAALLGVAQGAQVIRVHDVRETVQAIAVWQAGMDPDQSGL